MIEGFDSDWSGDDFFRAKKKLQVRRPLSDRKLNWRLCRVECIRHFLHVKDPFLHWQEMCRSTKIPGSHSTASRRLITFSGWFAPYVKIGQDLQVLGARFCVVGAFGSVLCWPVDSVKLWSLIVVHAASSLLFKAPFVCCKCGDERHSRV